MQRPISLKIYSIALSLLALMIIVTGLSARNLKSLNNEVIALSAYYIPLDQQVGSVETLIRQQGVHLERILLLQRLGGKDKAVLEQEQKLFDDRGINADQVIDSSVRLLEEGIASDKVTVDRAAFDFLRKALPEIQTARQNFHGTFRKFLVEAEEGNTRSIQIVREVVVKEKDDINAQLEKVILAIQKVTQDSANKAQTEEVKAIQLNWGITFIAGVLGLGFAAIITRSLVQPVRRLLRGTRAVEQGDLNIKVHASSTDEIAVLTESFNTMVAGLREKERIKSTFSQYVDPRIVKELLDSHLPTLGGERRVMTAFFSDIEGFTHICEQMTPDGVVRFLNQYFTLMSEPIRDNRGILDKFIGDGIMAFWGPPFTDDREHARLACFAALEQLKQLEKFNQMLPDLMGLRKGLPTVNIRIGIATGDVTVGSIGSEASKGYTVMGDTVNLASRLEGANKEYGSRILISEDTWNMARDAVEVRELDTIRVVGKSEPVRVFELLGRKGQLDAAAQELQRRFAQGLQCYRQSEWNQAETAFEACLTVKPDDTPSQTLLLRLRHFRDHATEPDPDGVWNLTKK
jgi:class 3 adenylate cyclase